MPPSFHQQALRAQAIIARLQPGDAVVVNAAYLQDVVNYYYRGELPVYGLPAQDPPDDVATRQLLEQLLPHYRRVWLLLGQDYYSDPRAVVESTLAGASFRFASEEFYGDIRVHGYQVLSVEQRTFGETALLLRHEVVDLRAGWECKVRLSWQALAHDRRDLKVFVHIVDAQGKAPAQHDGVPANGQRPVSSWQPGETVLDEHIVPIPPSLAGQQVSVLVGLYDAATGQRLSTGELDHLLLAREVVAAP